MEPTLREDVPFMEDGQMESSKPSVNQCESIQIDKNEEEETNPTAIKEHIAKLLREGPFTDGNPNVQHLMEETEPIEWIDKQLHLEGVKFYEEYRFAVLIAGLFSFYLNSAFRPLPAALLRTGEMSGHHARILITRVTQLFEAVNNWVSDKDSSAKGKTAQYTFKTWRSHAAASRHLHNLPMPPMAKITERRKREMFAIQNDVKKNANAFNKLPEEVTTYYPPNFITQLDHTMILFGIFGIILMCPTAVGIPSNYSKRGHKAFLYTWYITGKRLGIKDEYNLGGMTPAHGQEIINQVMLPSWANIDENNMEFYASIKDKNYWSPYTALVYLVKRIINRAALRMALQDVFKLEAKEFKKFFRFHDYVFHYFLMTLFFFYSRYNFVRWVLNTGILLATPIATKIMYMIGE